MRIFLATIFFLIGSVCMAQTTHPGWVVQPRLTTGNLYDVRFASRENGWIVGSQTILKTTNAGASWQMKEYPQSWFDNIVLMQGMDGWLIAANSSTSSFYVVRLDGESEMWLADTSLMVEPSLDALFFLNEDYGWTAGSDKEHKAVLYRTQNAGKSWDKIATGLDESIRDVFFIDVKTGWMVGQNGGFYKSTDGGLTWSFTHQALYTHYQQHTPLGYPVRRIFFKDPSIGWAVGGISGVEVRSRTTDGGQTWIEDIFLGGSSLQGMYFLDSMNGWAVGAPGPAGTTILGTTDAGQTWILQRHDINSNGVPLNNVIVNSVFMTSVSEGWIVGNYGTVLKTTSGGLVTAVEDEDVSVPLDFELGQNYPNPFNPSTTIEFSLAKESFVELTVTNTLGKKVATLVQGTHPAGRHAVHFEAADLPSGVYFYTLRSGGFAITKRLMLMK